MWCYIGYVGAIGTVGLPAMQCSGLRGSLAKQSLVRSGLGDAAQLQREAEQLERGLAHFLKASVAAPGVDSSLWGILADFYMCADRIARMAGCCTSVVVKVSWQ